MIDAALAGASALGDWLAVGLLHGTILAIITAVLVATVLRRARPAVIAALWAIVLVKFLVPVGPASDLSLFGAIERVMPRAEDPSPLVALDLAPVRADPGAAAAGLPDLAAGALFLLYVGPLLLLWARRLVAGIRLGRQLGALEPVDRSSAAVVVSLADRMAAPRPSRTLVDPAAAGPYLAGRLRPVLVIPGWLERTDPAWTAAIGHELAHLRRRDPLLALLPSAVSILFWFFPPALWVCRRLDRAREMACDEWAVAAGPLDQRQYAHFLVQVASRRRTSPAPGVTSFARSRSQLAARVEHMLSGPRGPLLGRWRAALVASWAVVCLAGASRAASPLAAAELCSLEPELIARILASHPSADADGDGLLSSEEACAHQRLMKQRLIDHVVDAELVTRLDPAADLDGDGVLSPDELDWVRSQMDVGLAAGAGDQMTLEYAGSRSLPLPQDGVRVAAAPATGPLCRSRARCGQSASPGQFPLLIDVSPAETQRRIE
jgi:beta-lactamase regulating signal transducer with metallopeptidase domain